jgi:hypothetical protein
MIQRIVPGTPPIGMPALASVTRSFCAFTRTAG